MIIVTKSKSKGFAAVDGDNAGTFVDDSIQVDKDDFCLQASIPVLQNEKKRMNRATTDPETKTANSPGSPSTSPAHSGSPNKEINSQQETLTWKRPKNYSHTQDLLTTCLSMMVPRLESKI